MMRQARDSRQAAFALPAALVMILLITSAVAILSNLSTHHLAQVSSGNSRDNTYLAAEGAVHKQIAEMSVLSTLWSQRVNLTASPVGYSEYSPIAYISSNGIPPCSGTACHRDMFPTGGGIIKNVGPVNGAGDGVDVAYSITEQLDPEAPPAADSTLSDVGAWTQIERLDETSPNAATVGGSLSNSVAEGGNARAVRYRITGYSFKSLRGRRGYATVTTVVEAPIS